MFNKYYSVLELPDNSSEELVKRQYKKLAIIYHPDKNSNKPQEERDNCEKKFKEISEAYEILTNKQKYNNNIMYNNCSNFNINPHDLFSQIFNQSNSQQFNVHFGSNMPNIVQTSTSVKIANGKKTVTVIENINGRIFKKEYISNV
tara:strand:- start:29 stop:466 length:438 start_codon:yes stop_codon:yes gene_type:complete